MEIRSTGNARLTFLEVVFIFFHIVSCLIIQTLLIIDYLYILDFRRGVSLKKKLNDCINNL